MRQALRLQSTTTNTFSRDLSTIIKSNNINNMYSTQSSGCTLPSTFQSPDLLDEKLFNLKLRCANSPQSSRFPTLHSSKIINNTNRYEHGLQDDDGSAYTYHAVSPAQLERFKSNYPKVSNLLNQRSRSTHSTSQINSDNVELIQRLEKLTYKYNTSVPVIIASWLSNGSSSNSMKIKLSEQDVRYLNQSINIF